jgi:hypothetical protein
MNCRTLETERARWETLNATSRIILFPLMRNITAVLPSKNVYAICNLHPEKEMKKLLITFVADMLYQN